MGDNSTFNTFIDITLTRYRSKLPESSMQPTTVVTNCICNTLRTHWKLTSPSHVTHVVQHGCCHCPASRSRCNMPTGSEPFGKESLSTIIPVAGKTVPAALLLYQQHCTAVWMPMDNSVGRLSRDTLHAYNQGPLHPYGCMACSAIPTEMPQKHVHDAGLTCLLA